MIDTALTDPETGFAAPEPYDTCDPVTLKRVINSEWIKFRTLRSTLAVLGAAVLGMLLIGLVVALKTRHLSADLQPDDTVASSTLQGYYAGQLLIGALGVLFVTGVRGTPGSLVANIAVILVLPVLFGSVLGQWGKDIAQFMPSEAGGSFVRSIHEPTTLAPWTGLGVLALWALAGIAAAALTLTRRDA